MASAVDRLIEDCYAVGRAHPLPDAGGGVPAYAVTDTRRGRIGLMALLVPDGQAPRAGAIAALAANPVPGVLTPLAYGASVVSGGAERCFVVSEAPTGPPLALAPGGLSEAALFSTVLLPSAAALEALRVRGLTHRSIRPGNLFSDARGGVVLGAAWAGAAASLQPVVIEPPQVAMCSPCSRGEGRIEDDVYALGVTLLAFALGRLPLAGLDSEAMLRRKLELGSFAALTERERVPSVLLNLLRGMLTDEGQRRTTPALLMDLVASGARRVVAGPLRHAVRPLAGFEQPVATARGLAYAVARDPQRGVRLLRSGAVERWLRRDLGDQALGVRIGALLCADPGGTDPETTRSEDVVALLAVATLDPLAPLCWRGQALWPEGIGAALTSAIGRDASEQAALEEVIALDLVSRWAAARLNGAELDALCKAAKAVQRSYRARGLAGGVARAAYALTPGARCRSGLLGSRWVAGERDLLLALDALGRDGAPEGLPLDPEIAAFVAAHADRSGLRHLQLMLDDLAVSPSPMLCLRVFAALQAKHATGPLPGLADWLNRGSGLPVTGWRGRTRRERAERALLECTKAGDLPGMLASLDDPMERSRDARDARRAEVKIRELDARIFELTGSGAGPAAQGRQLGRDLAAGVAIALAGVAIVANGIR